MLRCWKRLAQDKEMWTQHAQVLEETGAGQADEDTTCSGVGRDWSRTKRCGHSMLRCWKRLASDRQMWTQHAQVFAHPRGTTAGDLDRVPITGCLMDRVTKCRRYSDVCVGLPFPVSPFCKII